MRRSITCRQAQKFDLFARRKLGIPSLILMENAGRGVAEEALELIKGQRVQGAKGHVLIVCGTGNNGGDGLVAARHLRNAGIKVSILLAGPMNKLKPDPKINYLILKKMGTVPIYRGRFPRHFNLIIDSLFGIGLRSEVREPYASLIAQMNASGKPILAVDVPSGLDADSGKALGVAVKAKRTVTFVAEKKGLFLNDGPGHCGRIVVRDIGINAASY